jgi:hypothetical protein
MSGDVLSLPPNVEGIVQAKLIVTIDHIAWHTPDDSYAPFTASHDSEIVSHNMDNLCRYEPNPLEFGICCVRVVWYGEEGRGTLFRPATGGAMVDIPNNTVAFPVRCGYKHLGMYLNDMGNLVLDVFHFEVVALTTLLNSQTSQLY